MTPYRSATVAALLISVLFAFAADAAIVRGTVSAPGGTRLSGMRVEAYDLTGVLRGTATTDAGGAYTLALPAGQYRLLAYDPVGTYATTFYPDADSFEGSAPVTAVEGSPVQADFTLFLGGTISGTVTAMNAPLANAVVEVYNLTGSRRGFTRTNAAGEFSLVVPAGDFKVFAYDSNGFYAGEFYANARAFTEAQALRVLPDSPRSLVFALEPAATVGGGVFDALTGLGIPGLEVYAYTPAGAQVATTITDAQGLFRLTLPGGQYRFVSADRTRTYATAFWINARAFSRSEILTVGPGASRLDVRLTAERAATIQGNVASLGALVTAYNLDGTVHARTQVGSFGDYSLTVAPGQYRLAAEPLTQHATQFYAGTPDFAAAQVITLIGGQTLTIDFQPPRAGLFSGTVRDAVTQQPLAGMTVAAYDASGVRVAETSTRSDGSYALLVAPGEYRLVAFDPRLEYATAYAPSPRTVTVDSATPLDFTLRRGTRVSGTVVLPNGTGVEGAEILVFDLSGNPVAGATTAADGTFTLVLLPGSYTFVARTQFVSVTRGPIDVGAVSPAPVGFVLEGSGRRRSARH